MPDTEILNILTINYNTIGTREMYRATSYSRNTAITWGAGYEQHYRNTRQEAGKLERCYINTSITSNLKSYSTDNPMVSNKEIEYFLPALNQDNERITSAEITKQLPRDFEDVLVE